MDFRINASPKNLNIYHKNIRFFFSYIGLVLFAYRTNRAEKLGWEGKAGLEVSFLPWTSNLVTPGLLTFWPDTQETSVIRHQMRAFLFKRKATRTSCVAITFCTFGSWHSWKVKNSQVSWRLFSKDSVVTVSSLLASHCKPGLRIKTKRIPLSHGFYPPGCKAVRGDLSTIFMLFPSKCKKLAFHMCSRETVTLHWNPMRTLSQMANANQIPIKSVTTQSGCWVCLPCAATASPTSFSSTGFHVAPLFPEFLVSNKGS